MGRYSSSGAASRLRKYLGSIVEVHMLDGRVLKGKLVELDDDLLNIFLEDVEDSEGRKYPAVCVCGGSITYISVVAIPLRVRDVREETLEEKVLNILKKNSNLSPEEIAHLINAKPSSVRMAISRLRRKGLLREFEDEVDSSK